MKILAIDPGNTESGYCIVDSETYKPLEFGKVDNAKMRSCCLLQNYDLAVIEMVASYGSAAGASLFETCIAIGRFEDRIERTGRKFETIKRKQYITDLTSNPKANDAIITQYLIDRFAPNTPNRGKGVKAAPGFFYGFGKDIWQAYAIAVWRCDQLNGTIY